MGMFDTVRSSYPLISAEADLELQTKDLDCLMRDYWISPAGQLYRIDTSAAYDAVEIKEELRERPWQLIEWVRNGRHGVVAPENTTALVTLYPGRVLDGEQEWPWVKAYFKNGVIQEVLR